MSFPSVRILPLLRAKKLLKETFCCGLFKKNVNEQTFRFGRFGISYFKLVGDEKVRELIVNLQGKRYFQL